MTFNVKFMVHFELWSVLGRKFQAALVIWKVLLDVVFLELVRHLKFHLLYNIKQTLICVTVSH